MSDRVFDPRSSRPGDPVTAAGRNARNAAILRAGRLSGNGGIVAREGASGRSLALATPEVASVKLTTTANGDGGYGAKEVLATPAGTWIDAGRTMPQTGDPCYERNHNVSLAAGDRVYLARRAATTGEWIFAHKAAGGSGGGGGGVVVSCAGSPVPTSLTLSFTHCHYEPIPDPPIDVSHTYTLGYGANPWGDWTALVTDFMSNGLFPDPCNEVRWNFGCIGSGLSAYWKLEARFYNPTTMSECPSSAISATGTVISSSPLLVEFTLPQIQCDASPVIATVSE